MVLKSAYIVRNCEIPRARFYEHVGETFTIEMHGRGDLNFNLIVDLEFENSTDCANLFSPLTRICLANYEKFLYCCFDARNGIFFNLLGESAKLFSDFLFVSCLVNVVKTNFFV